MNTGPEVFANLRRARPPQAEFRRVARRALYALVVTFSCARLIVIAIMARWIPDLYMHVGGTHVHHLNYGIFLLVGVGAYLLFADPGGRGRLAAAAVYGVALGLTFDEFGMWLHLGGPYWQRASFDAIVVIAALLALLAFFPRRRPGRRFPWLATAVLIVIVGVFAGVLIDSVKREARRLGPEVERFEERGPR